MLTGFILASAIARLGAPAHPFLQDQAGREQQKSDDKKPFVAPTPWFNKDEDTFDLPVDPARRKQLAQDVKDGRADAIDVLKEVGASTNMAYQERVERIGQIIAHAANHMHAIATYGDKRFSPYHYHYTVLKGDDVNAFSIEGGYIFVYEGLMEFVESDDELAGVLGHETAHAAFRHIATREAQQQKAQFMEIPALIAAIATRSPGGLLAVEGFKAAFESAWSIEAEKAADYGGFQFISKTQYNPVAMLTFMERLALKIGFYDRALDNTVMQTHPITKERAEALEDDLKRAGIPILRSKASAAFRVTAVPNKDGTVSVLFGKAPFYKFGGPDAKARADAAVPKLNSFFDSVPRPFEVTENPATDAVLYRGVPVLTVEPEDAVAQHTVPGKLLESTLDLLKNGILFHLNFVVARPENLEGQ